MLPRPATARFDTQLGSDVAFNIADMLYGQLVLGQQLQAPVQQQWRQQQQHQMDRASPASSFSSAARRHRRDDSEHVPPGWTGPLLLSVDAAQAATMFMAIMALQQRLDREEGERQVRYEPAVAGCSESVVRVASRWFRQGCKEHLTCKSKG